MKKRNTQTERIGGLICCVLCVATLAFFALFAACERPEPEPEPPTPPVVDPDQFINNFVGTWVLCGQSPAEEEPSCSCSEDLNSIDTLVFTSDKMLTIKHGSQQLTFNYDYTPSFLLFYLIYDEDPSGQLWPKRAIYGFGVEGNKLNITGYLPKIQGSDSKTTSCFVKINTPTDEPAVASEVPVGNRYLGTWASCCWTTDLNEDPDYNCEPGGDTLVFTENTMIQKTTWCGVVENGYEYTNTCSYLIYFRENLGFHQPNFIRKTKFINDSVFIIYAWDYPAYNPTGGPDYNVSFKKVQ